MIRILAGIFLLLLSFSAVTMGQSRKSAPLPVEQDGKCGYIDKTGTIVIPPQFQDCWTFSEGFACVVVGGKTGFIDEAGKYLVEPQFNAMYGCADEFKEGFVSVNIGDWRSDKEKYGFLDTRGEVIYFPGVTLLGDFHEGLALFKKNGLSGYLDTSFKVIVKPKFRSAGNFYNGRARATDTRGREYYIDQTGRKLFPNRDGSEFQNGYAFFKEKGKYGFINTDGKVVIAPRFDFAQFFGDGLANVKVGKKWGFVDETGRFVIEPQFDDAGEFAEGLARVAMNGKWGYIDKTGRLVVPYQFDRWVTWFEDGISPVYLDGKFGYINKNGDFIWIPTK